MIKLHGPLAQSVEHLAFNQGVPGSSPGWITKSVYSGQYTVNSKSEFKLCLESLKRVLSENTVCFILSTVNCYSRP